MREEAGVDHDVIAFTVEKRPTQEPFDERVPIGRLENVIERVSRLSFASAAASRDQMQVMVPEHDDGALVELADETKNVERARSAVHEIANEPQAIVRRVEIDAHQKPLERDKTSLYVPDDVGGHAGMIRHER